MKQMLKFWRHMCTVYTVSALLFILLNLALAGTLENTIINPDAFLMIFVFAAVFALANLIYGVSAMPYGVRLALHFVLVTLGAFLCLYLPSDSGTGGASGKLLMLIALALIYWFIMALYLALARVSVKVAVSKHQSEESTYQNVFKK